MNWNPRHVCLLHRQPGSPNCLEKPRLPNANAKFKGSHVTMPLTTSLLSFQEEWMWHCSCCKTVVMSEGRNHRTTSFEGKSFLFLHSRKTTNQRNRPTLRPFVWCTSDTCVLCHCIIHVYIWLTQAPWGFMACSAAADMSACRGVPSQYIRMDEAPFSSKNAAFCTSWRVASLHFSCKMDEKNMSGGRAACKVML